MFLIGAGYGPRLVFVLIGLVALWAPNGSAAELPPDTRPAATTEPADLSPEVTAAAHLMAAGNPSVVPTAMLWLGSERDGIRVGQASSRLRVAFHVMRKFHVTSAVPWLVAIYDDPSAEPAARNAAAEAAIRLDPFYSREFLDDVLDDQLVPPGELEWLSTAQCAAAEALSQINDERALTMLFDAMTDYLDALDRGGPEAGKAARNYLTAIAISRMDNPELLKRLRTLSSRYLHKPAAGRLRGMIYQMEVNHLPVEQLLAMAAPEKDVTQREVAILALGNKAGVETVPFIESTERSVVSELGHLAVQSRPSAETEPAAEPQSNPKTRPDADTRPAIPATGPVGSDNHVVAAGTQPIAQTRPAKRSAKEEYLRHRELAQACRDAVTLIAARTPLREAMPPLEMMTRGSANPPGEPVPDDAELVFLYRLVTRSVGDTKVHVGELCDPQGLLPAWSVVVRDQKFYESLIHVPYASLARVALSADRADLVGLRVIDRGPGETAPDGYTCRGHTPVREGQWQNQAVRLRKYGMETVALIPNRHKPDGTTGPDAEMWKIAEALGPGDPVVARFESGPGQPILQSLAPYRPPLPATFVKLTKVDSLGGQASAAELIVARRRAICLLPQEQSEWSDPLSLNAEALGNLPAGAPLSVILDERSNPPKLLNIRFDGGISLSPDGNALAIRTGKAIYVARRERGWHGALQIGGSRNIGTYILTSGFDAIAATDPSYSGVSSPEVAALLQKARDHSLPSYAAVDEAMPELVARWTGADPVDQPGIEREMHQALCNTSIEVTAHAEMVYREARNVISPRLYRRAMSMGQPVIFPNANPVFAVGKQMQSATTQKGDVTTTRK